MGKIPEALRLPDVGRLKYPDPTEVDVKLISVAELTVGE